MSEEVLSKEEMYSLWLEMCPDKERLKEAFRKAFMKGSCVDILNDYGTSVFESWYSEFIKEK